MKPIYLSKHIKAVDSLAAEFLQISTFKLMQKAGQSIFSYVQNHKKILVITGAGNNAGDGFIIACLAMQKGINISVWSLIKIESLPTDAQMAAQQYLLAGGKIIDKQPEEKYDCIVDAIFGTGLCRDILGIFADAVNWINAQTASVVAVDIPSGLDADTGIIRACAVHADVTVAVICYKPGLVTNNGKDLCGNLYLESLEIPEKILQRVPAKIQLLDASVLKHKLLQHHHNSHKGSFGQAIIAGGHDGMLGALILAGRSALQSGCGMVEVVSNCQQSVLISIQHPELITANNIKATRLIKSANVIAIGPGLGLNQQSKEVLDYCIAQNKPMVIDADALTLIAQKYKFRNNVVLTPHPKEAATLLNTDVATIQSNRVAAAKKISNNYQATVILKGSGTIVGDASGNVFICPFGYSGMATAGMGDVLTGIVASLIAQGFSTIDAANTAVIWHAIAAENAHKGNCLIASDVMTQLAKEIPCK
ncbi:MAG: NAD(P)H-hydrate dehydratase [Alcanivoracaceae bacterium]|nr:NAD(P)H-hydrate dehydratase [Alcanivoracaceae bacterium]